MRVDNTTTYDYVYDNMQQKKSKAFDTRLYFPQDRINNEQFEIHWMKGESNKADYYSKHHTQTQHKNVRST